MRIKHTINPRISDDAAGEDRLYGPEDTKELVTNDTCQKLTHGKFSVAAGANEDLAFGDVADVRGIYIKADQDFNLKFNGGSEILSLKRPQTSAGTAAAGAVAKVFLDADITAVNVTNPGTSTLNGRWVVWGDPIS